jgi:xylulokinase
VEQLNLVGGGAASDVWCQIFADVLNIEIRQVIDPIQANARGAAFIAAAGLGEIGFADVPDLVQLKRIYTPSPQNQQLYEDGFGAFEEIYKRMNSLYRKLNS